MARGKRKAPRPVEAALIKDQLADGRGVAAVAGKTVFVDAAIKNEFVRFQRQRGRRNVDEARLIEVLRPSPDRTEPVCSFFSVCGGCSMQHLQPAAQIQVKEQALFDAFARLGGVEPQITLPALAGRPTGYRRRARLGARYVAKKDKVLVGFREKHKPYIAEMDSCQTLAPRLSDLIAPLAELIAELEIARDVPQVEMSLGDQSLSLVFRVLQPPSASDRERLAEFERLHRATVWLQSGGPQTLQLLDPAQKPEELTYGLPAFDLELAFGPLDFIQVNQDMNRRMIAQALELLGDLNGARVLDLFCGIGNFSLPLARHSKHVTGVELAPAMVAKARANAQRNELANTEFHAADLADSSWTNPADRPPWAREPYDVVLLDPPRAGAAEILPVLGSLRPGRILYVSCHAGSLARDAGLLTAEYGYSLVSAGAMDMFPQTSHVEAMALFTLNE